MEKKRVNIVMPDLLHSRAKALAVLSNKTLNDYLVKAIEEKIKKDLPLIKGLIKK